MIKCEKLRIKSYEYISDRQCLENRISYTSINASIIGTMRQVGQLRPGREWHIFKILQKAMTFDKHLNKNE